jgi:hypothetical protein
MLKKIVLKILIASIITFIGYHTYIQSSGRDTVTCSNVVMGSNQNVKGQTTNCGPVEAEKSSFNAAGDKADWGDLSAIRKAMHKDDKWGIVAKTEHHTLKFPKAGEKKIISLMPTDGRLKTKDVEILLVSFDKRTAQNHPEAPADIQAQFERVRESTQFNSMIKIYRKTGKEPLWTELYEIFSDEYSQKLEIKVSVSPAGIIKTEKTIKETDADGMKHDIQPFEIDLAGFE